LPTVDEILGQFRRQVSLPWAKETLPDYRVWIMHYEKSLERRIHGRLHEFESAVTLSGRGCTTLNLASLVPNWFAENELFEGLVAQPDELPGMLFDFQSSVAKAVSAALDGLGENDMLALIGAGALFGLIRVSALTEKVAPLVRGRLLLLFPGRHDNGVYRLLDARDGWSYRATPIPS